MLTQKLQRSFIKSLHKLYEDELILERLSFILPKVDIDDLNSFNLMLLNLNQNLLSTYESLQKNKKKILNDKLNLLKINFQNTKLSPILQVESTLKEKDLIPFWTKSSKEKSKKLWLPTKTDFAALDLTSSNTFVTSLTPNLPFSQIQIQIQKMALQSSQMILWQLSLTSPLNTTVKENTRYCRKIPIYTSKEHRELFNKCFNATRYFYNKAVFHSNEQYQKQKKQFEESKKCLQCDVDLLEDQKFFCNKHKKCKLKWKINTSFISLRKEILVNDKDLEEKDEWQKEVPYDTRQLAIKAYAGNLKSALSNYKNGNIKHFKMSYKRRKEKKHVCYINKNAIDSLRIFKRRLKTPVRVRKRYDVYRSYKPESDCILMKDHNKYYLLFPKKRKVVNKKPLMDTVSLDPGRNTFQTFYSPNGVCGKLGDQWYLELEKLCKKIDNLQSLRSKMKGKRGLVLRHFKLRTKMKNVVSDMHYKMCDYLTKSYKNIIISDFMTSKMISYSKLNRDLRVQSHYMFKCKLDQKCKERGRNLIVTTEEYTSKTCGGCGELNDVGLSRVLKCKICGLKIDRDYNGARNILLKYISKG